MRTPTPAFRSPSVARLSPLAAGIALAFSPAYAATFVVTTALDIDNPDDSVMSLREAIMGANAACNAFDGFSTITFSGPFTISPSSPLPAFDCLNTFYNVTVDGGGSVLANSYDTNVTLNGSGSSSACGLHYSNNFTYGGAFTVKGMKIQNHSDSGTSAGICSNGTTFLYNNWLSNNSIGAALESGNGTTVGDFAYGGNIFSSNGEGLRLRFTSNAIIENNRVGTSNGTGASPNNRGIYLYSNSNTQLLSNQISGNTYGVYSDYGGDVYFEGNNIGLKADGASALPNTNGGVFAQYTGTLEFEDDYISGNGVAGVRFDYSGQLYVYSAVIGEGFGGENVPNAVGIEAFCSGYVGIENSDIKHNTGDGVSVAGADTVFLQDNLIHENGGFGVRITASTCQYGGTFTALEDNEVSDNGGDGIAVFTTGWTELGGGSTFGNGGKNFNSPNKVPPQILSVVHNSDLSADITYRVTGPIESNVHLQFYANSSASKAAGETFIGETSVFIASSPQEGTFTIGGPPALEGPKAVSAFTILPDNISATAESGGCCSGHTSEFSFPVPATTAPQLVVSPPTFNFGTLEVDSTSPAVPITLRSVGDQDLVIDYIGTDPFCYGGPICYGGSFICSTTCSTGTSYATGQSCTITAQFAPTFLGSTVQNIYVCSNGLGSPQTITLSGEAIPPPPLALSPTAWDFGDVAVGTASAVKGFTLSNRYDGNLPVVIATVGEFDIVTNDCAGSVPAGGSCHIGVAFGPSASGASVGDLNVTIPPLGDAAAAAMAVKGFSLGSPTARAILRGNGVVGGTLELPESILVGSAIVGGDGITQIVTIRNNGTAAVTIAGLQISEGFTLEHNCPESLEPGASCQLTIGFTAQDPGEVHGTLTVTSSAISTAIPVTAVGQTAATALLRITPVSIGFGSRLIGSQSSTQTVTIQNVGAAAASSFSLASSTIDFILSGNSCGASLAAGATCTANIAFRPLGFGTRFGSLVVTSSAVNSPGTVGLAGTGCRPFSAASSRFGSGPSCAP